VIAVPVTDKNRLRMQVDQVLCAKGRAAQIGPGSRGHLEPVDIRVEQNDSASERGRIAGVGDPGKNDPIPPDVARARIDVFHAEKFLPGSDGRSRCFLARLLRRGSSPPADTRDP